MGALALVRSLRRRSSTVHSAVGLNRKVIVHGQAQVTVRPTWWAWQAMGEQCREGRPREVTFGLWEIRGGMLRTATWWRPGLLRLDVPTCGDPWGRRSRKMVEQRVFPRPRPSHRIRFRRAQQPWFVYMAEEIGIQTPEEA
jgi:hypothetical protein